MQTDVYDVVTLVFPWDRGFTQVNK